MNEAHHVPGRDPLATAFARLRDAFRAERYPSRRVRLDRLARLDAALRAHQHEIAAAIAADFGHRSQDETLLLEVFPTLEAIKHARRELAGWMAPQRRPTSKWFLPGSSQLITQPLGVIGIVVPWNYPVFLALAPLVGALAAGNRAMLKLSESTPRTAVELERMLSSAFADGEVAVALGDASVGRAFSALPFDHLLFTGSTRVGAEVMRAASANLTPVTLELGGKSPAIVAPGYPIEHAAERILVGKCMNAGQTCIAPDYVLVPASDVERFVAAAGEVVHRLYPRLADTPDYTSIVDVRHFDRLVAWLDEARASGARATPLGPLDAPIAATRRFPPIALTGVDASAHVMREEIFGPLLPVVPYASLDEAIEYVNARAHPLALYYFDRDRTRVERLLEQTLAGGVTINDTILHIAQEELPFGGVGGSGMGHYHGYAGYLAFSKQKGVFRQARWSGIGLFKPPYGARFRRLLGILLR